MTFNTFGDKANPVLLLVPGLGVSYGIFLPLIHILEDRFRIVAAGIDGFLLGKESAGRLSSTMPSWMPHRCCLSPSGW